MSLFALLRKNLGFSLAASALQFITTLLVLRLAGPILFADFTVDLYKLAILIICLEIVPSSYVTFRSQKDPELARHMASFALLSALFCLLAWAALAAVGLFKSHSVWMAGYAIYLALQRYLDIRLQAENRVSEYYQILTANGCIRLLLILAGFRLTALPPEDILWASLSLASLLPVIGWALLNRAEMSDFLRKGHLSSLVALHRERPRYYGYYANTVLKRIRDSLMPVAASFFVGDKIELARYLLAMRGVEAVMGQLRLVEAILSHYGNRAMVAAKRGRQLLLLAFLAQIATFVLSLALSFQTGLALSTWLACGAASLFAYPYLLELGYRSDAYAAHLPKKVTVSLASFAGVLAGTLLLLDQLHLLFAPGLVLAHVLAQAIAAATYRIGRRAPSG